MQVVLAGQSVSVDPQTLQFSGNVALTAGSNRIQAIGTDAAGRMATAEVQGAYVPPGFASYAWETPVDGAQSATRTMRVAGQADQPGILSIMVNGVPVALSSDGALGRFSGEVVLASTGRNTLYMEVRTLAGETRTEKRDVIFEPELPRIRLMAPDSARPGDTIPIQVSPESGTKLLRADLTWNGRYLATVTEPFGSVSAVVPADAVVGDRISLEAVGTGVEGATVTARMYVTVFGSGALMVEAYDDRLGLPLTDKTAVAAVEGGESQILDGHGRAALATALPQNWIKVSKPGFTPVWRSAALQVGGVQSLVDARLTSMEKTQDVDTSGFTGEFGGGTLKLAVPEGTPGSTAMLSVTPLSAQGLPGLLPLGWSAISAWWIQLEGATSPLAGKASLILPAATPALPADGRYAWVRWDETLHVWVVLAAGLPANGLADLSMPSSGGYALLMADPGATAPPAAVAGSVLAGFEGSGWRDGVKAFGSVDPSLMPTVDAIRGAKATAIFGLAFEGSAPLPSGVPIQTDVLESYTLLDSATIEPDGFSQDVVASRWMLEVVDGKPALAGAEDGLGLRLPVHMSRTFGEAELVEGRIFVGFYHDGVQVAQSGSELLGASGGVVSRDGVNLSFASGSLPGTTLVRLSVDSGDASLLWPELAGKGMLAKSFNVDIVGTLLAGLGLSMDALDLPDTARPLVLQRRVVQGERLVVAIGELKKSGSSWVLATPGGGNAVLEGGAFAVLAPASNWDWISGTALLPGSTAQPLMQNLGAKARMMPVKALAISPLPSSEDVAVADVIVDGGFLQAVSGSTGAFAVPAWVPTDATAVSVKGERRDLGVTGTFSAFVPSSDNLLRLATVPFRVLNAVPASLSGGSTLKRGGQMLQQTSYPSGSYILASSLTDELVRGGGEVMGIDKDFGTRAFSGTSYGGPGGIFGTYYHVPTLHFVVDPSQMGDHQPPYEELSFEVLDGSGAYRPVEVANVGDQVYAVIKVHDNQTDFTKVVLDLKIDNIPHPKCYGDCSQPNWTNLESYSMEHGLAVFRFKVGILSEGKHAVVASAFDQDCNKATQTKELTILSFGSELPPIPNIPPTATLEVQGDLASVRTDSTIRVRFSEPVTGVSATSLLLERFENGAFVSEPVRLFGHLGEVNASQGVSEVMILPLSPLKTGTRYQVRFLEIIQDSEQLKLQVGPLGFMTASYVAYPKLDIPAGRIADVTALGNMVYVGVDEKIQAWFYEAGGWSPQGLIGPGADGGFYGQDLVRVRAFPDAALGKDDQGNDERGSLLLVTTTPKDWQSNYQSVLWAYRACGAPELLFAVSLGQGASAYSPSMDYRDGIIAVGRLTSSVALIDVNLARDGWRTWITGGGSPSMAYTPYGVNQRSIIQPFYMMDPESSSVPAAWGVGLLPMSTADATGTSLKIGVAVGFLAEGLRGMPNSIQQGDASNWIPQPPFVGPANGPDARTVAMPLTDGRGITRLAVVPGLEIIDADGRNPRTTNLAVGLSASTRLYLVDEGDPAHPKELGYWDAPGTIQYRQPAVDEINKWVAVPVVKTEGLMWEVLSLRVPSKPTVIAELKGLGGTGTLSHGVLFTAGNGVLSAVDFNQQAAVSAQVVAKATLLNTTLNPNLDVAQKVTKMAEAVSNALTVKNSLAQITPTACPPKLAIVQPSLTSPALWVNRDPKNNGRPTMSNVALGAAFSPDPNGLTWKATYDWTATFTYVFKRSGDKGGNIILTEPFPKNSAQGHQSEKGGQSPDSLYEDSSQKVLVRGGTLEVQVKAEGQTAIRDQKHNSAIKVFGQNPTSCDIAHLVSELDPDTTHQAWLLKIADLESHGGKQFSEHSVGTYNIKDEPLVNDGGDGGMGIFQITPHKAISDLRRWDLLWNWAKNVEAGVQLLQDKIKEVTGLKFPEKVRSWANREGLAQLNAYRKAQNLQPFAKVEIPDYPDPTTYNLEDAIRYFNGFGSKDPATWLDKHEFFPAMVETHESFPYAYADRTYTKRIWNKEKKKWEIVDVVTIVEIVSRILDVEPSKTDPTIAVSRGWRRYPTELRVKPWTGLAEGDPNYVEDLRARTGIQCNP